MARRIGGASRSLGRGKASATLVAKRNLRDFEKVQASAKAMGGDAFVKVGWPAGGANPYPDGTPVVSVAVWNEFGTRFLAERPFLRNGSRAAIPDVKKLNRINLPMMTRGEKTVDAALGEMGEVVLTHIDRKIVELGVIDTGHLRQSSLWRTSKGAEGGA